MIHSYHKNMVHVPNLTRLDSHGFVMKQNYAQNRERIYPNIFQECTKSITKSDFEVLFQ